VIKYVLWLGGLCFFAAGVSAGTPRSAVWMGAVAGALAAWGLGLGVIEILAEDE
jgi:hypothetical protein